MSTLVFDNEVEVFVSTGSGKDARFTPVSTALCYIVVAKYVELNSDVCDPALCMHLPWLDS